MTTFRVTANTAGIEALFDGLATEAEAAARPAAQAGAQVLYDEVRKNVDRIKRRTGNLSRSIYQAYSKDNSGSGKAVYHVSWNAKKAPHGHLVEYGHLQRYEVSFDKATGRFVTHKDRPLPQPRQVAARPFLRPALAKLPAALQAARDRYLAELQAKGLLK